MRDRRRDLFWRVFTAEYVERKLAAGRWRAAGCFVLGIAVSLAVSQCAGCGDDCGPLELDAAQLDAGGLDAPTCGGPFEPCCPGNDVRCEPGTLCNANEVCEPECFPFCADGGR